MHLAVLQKASTIEENQNKSKNVKALKHQNKLKNQNKSKNLKHISRPDISSY